MKILASRLSRGDPTCTVCNQGEEDVMHMLFLCLFAKACWLIGSLALQTENLPHDLSEIFKMIEQQSLEEEWTVMVNVAWTIWRCRNKKVYGGKVPSFERFKQLLKKVDMETRIAASAKANYWSSRESRGSTGWLFYAQVQM